jgi:hypothetical protein
LTACSNALVWICSGNVAASSPMLLPHMACYPITSNHSWHVPWHQSWLAISLLGWACVSLGAALPESPTALWHRNTLNLTVHIV